MISKKEALEFHAKIEQELRDTFTKRATPQWASVIDDLLKSMKYLEEIAYGEKEDECKKPEDIAGTMIDNRIMDIYSEFEGYTGYKKTYETTKSPNDKMMMLDELKHMMNNMFEFVKELWANTDSQEERDLILTQMKSCYNELK